MNKIGFLLYLVEHNAELKKTMRDGMIRKQTGYRKGCEKDLWRAITREVSEAEGVKEARRKKLNPLEGRKKVFRKGGVRTRR